MDHEVIVFDDVDALARAGAQYVSELAHEHAEHSPFTIALSGGRTPWLMLDHWATTPMTWDRAIIYQVDERVAPAGGDERNLTHLRASLAAVVPRIEAMDVNGDDLDEAARSYAARLPARFNVVHLGLGVDGHCASLVPHDPVLDVTNRLVAPTQAYQGTRRLTLTYPAIGRADQLLWLVSGDDKRDALAKLLDGDTSIPAGRVDAPRSLVLADRAAMSS